MGAWISHNWFDLVSAIGIIASLLFTAVSLRSETKTRRVANLLTLTAAHRDIWSIILEHPELTRVLDRSVNISLTPVTLEETVYVNIIIQHVSAAYQALKGGLSVRPDDLCEDIQSFFSLPIPNAVWAETKRLQNHDFVTFVESCRKAK